MTKYREFFQNMVSENKTLFDEFRKIHDKYHTSDDPDSLQKDFNRIGEQVMLLIREWEDRLCGRSEKGQFSAFTGKLAEKFQEEVRREFPAIDRVGIIVHSFEIKRIELG